MKDNNLIALSLIYYDTQKRKYKKYYKKNITLLLGNKDNDLDLPIFYLKKNDNILIEGNFNIIGYFNKEKNEFTWGWYIIFSNEKKNLIKNNTYFVKQIINYILDLNIDQNNYIEEILFYKDLQKFFLNPKILIDNPIQLEIILAITLYITKSDMIYKLYDQKNNIDKFYLLKNIKINN